ncbi:MAG TPA: hypothetical protein DEB40_08695, partial [Elusimicrobia bacterium]|nr:hypothetical protein [Elusimicrobiota bacterium]
VAARDRALATREIQLHKAQEDNRSRVADLQEKLNLAQKECQALQEELWEKQRAWEVDRQALREKHEKIESQREARYVEMERSLQSLWMKKEADLTARHQAAMDKLRVQFSEELKRLGVRS